MRFQTLQLMPTRVHVAVCQAIGHRPAPALGILIDPLTGQCRLLEVSQ